MTDRSQDTNTDSFEVTLDVEYGEGGPNVPTLDSTNATDGDIRGRGAVAFEWEAVGGGHTSHVWYRARQAGARNREWSDRHKTLAFAIKDALEIANDG